MLQSTKGGFNFSKRRMVGLTY